MPIEYNVNVMNINRTETETVSKHHFSPFHLDDGNKNHDRGYRVPNTRFGLIVHIYIYFAYTIRTHKIFKLVNRDICTYVTLNAIQLTKRP